MIGACGSLQHLIPPPGAGMTACDFLAQQLLTGVANGMLMALLNMLIERLAYRPLRRAPRLAPLISAIGVSFILVNVGLLWKGPAPLNFPNYIPRIDILNEWFKMKTVV